MISPSGLLTGGLLCAVTPPLSHLFLTHQGSQGSGPTEKDLLVHLFVLLWSSAVMLRHIQPSALVGFVLLCV